MINKKLILNSLLVLLSILALLWPAIYNGFPLVYSDTGSYIHSGFNSLVPIDRPIFYGLFVRHTSLAHSLWFVIISQAIVVWFVLFMAIRIINKVYPFTLTLLGVITLSLTTGVSNYTSQIMPDIFSAIVILGFTTLALSKEYKILDYILLLIVILSITLHLSNLIIVIGLGIICLILMILKFISFKKTPLLIFCILFPFLIIYGTNYSLTGKAKLSKASNVFIVARMIETGVVKDFLNENCNNDTYIFCNKIDQLPSSSVGFIWNDDSPLFDEECRSVNWTYCWEEKNEELGKLSLDIIKNPKYRNKLISRYSIDFFQQLIDFDIGVLTPQTKNSTSYRLIDEKIHNDLYSYTQSKQYGKVLKFKILSIIQYITVILSLLIVVILLLIKRNKTLIQYLSLILFGIIGNALTVTVLSTILDRYQSRIIWLIPFVCFLIVISYFNSNEIKTTANK